MYQNVNALAKKAAGYNDNISIFHNPFTDYKDTFKRAMFEKTAEYVLKLGETKGINYFKTFYKKALNPWFFNKKLPRELIVTINRLRADHYNLAASLAKVKIVNDATCVCNNSAPEDIDHVVWQCPLYNNHRVKLIKSLRQLNLQIPTKMSTLLMEPNINACKHVLNFLENCNLKV